MPQRGAAGPTRRCGLHAGLIAAPRPWRAARGAPRSVVRRRYSAWSDAEGRFVPPVRWAPIKAFGRAYEKIYRSYGKDVSRLVDACRQSIVFDSAAAMAACLAAIARDPDVVVERVKNRMDPAGGPRPAGGYRDVALNLRLDSEETRALGAEAHVCELQLLLRGFDSVKSDQGHRHYVAARNLRSE